MRSLPSARCSWSNCDIRNEPVFMSPPIKKRAHPIAMPGIEEELLCSIFPSNVARWTPVSLGVPEYLRYFGPAEVSAVLCSSGSCCAL